MNPIFFICSCIVEKHRFILILFFLVGLNETLVTNVHTYSDTTDPKGLLSYCTNFQKTYAIGYTYKNAYDYLGYLNVYESYMKHEAVLLTIFQCISIFTILENFLLRINTTNEMLHSEYYRMMTVSNLHLSANDDQFTVPKEQYLCKIDLQVT